MKTKFKSLLAAGTLLAALLSKPTEAHAQGTAFTYQGQLYSGSNLANGKYDFQFALSNAPSGGSQIGSTLFIPAVGVTNGLFTTTLDFGAVYSGQSNWLGISVRSNGAGNYLPLSPLQRLTPTPYAVYAESANATNLVGTVQSANLSGVALLGAANTFTSGNQIITGGSVGIGTAAPFTQLANTPNNIFGSDSYGLSAKSLGWYSAGLGYAAGFYNPSTANGPGLDGVVIGIATTNSASRVLDLNAGGNSVMVVNGNGAIGIGTTTPANKLDVQGTADFTGDVGIGTTTPIAHFHVDGGVFETPQAAALFEVQNCGAACAEPSWTEAVRLMNTEGNDAGLVGMGFLTATSPSLINVPDVWIGTDDRASGNTHSFKIATQSGGVLTNRVFINGTNGNVGIGTTTPSTALQVNGTITATGFAGPGNGLTGVALLNQANTFTSQQTFKVNDTDYGCVITDGTNQLGAYIGLGQCSYGTITAHGLGFFVNDGYDSMFLDTNGNFGIGTSTPSAKLEVNGNAQVDGTLAANYLRAPGAGINTATYAFTQLAVSTNTSGNLTTIYNPITDNDPNAILVVTHNWTRDSNSTNMYNTNIVGVYYASPHWTIFNENNSGMALGRAFNVMVVKP